MLKISRIDIKNFRSAKNLALQPGQLSVFVGKNDSGKSNILRALNLFFNGKTDPAKVLNFEADHNIFNNPNRRAREIKIQLEIEIPETYKENNGDFVVWQKHWREHGEVFNAYKGYKRVSGRRGAIHIEEVEISAKSNLHGLLRNINFIYVPAIKDLEYFSELRASIYGVIAEVADREFRDSSQGFESSISNQLQDLTIQITKSLGLKSRLALPKDLSHIFESLDFLSEGHGISLDARGDGVKARHIPLILKFMADKKRGLQVRGAQPHTFIWGYEEPENSLELASSVELADQFWSFLNCGISQIFLTTHSPIFYNLHRKEVSEGVHISCHHMYRDTEEDGTKEASELSDLDERMGTTALFSPMVADLEERIRRQEHARREVDILAAANRRKIFVEGPSDKDIILKAFRVFSPEHANEIDIETRQNAGHSYVIDMLSSWRSRAKHHQELPKAAGLLDKDEDASKSLSDWNKVPDNIKSAKCFKLPTPPHIQPILDAGFRIPVVLETLYDLSAWQWAEEHGHLQARNIISVIPESLNSRILNGETTLDESLTGEWSIFIKKMFMQAGKGPMARHFSRKSDEEFRQRFSFLEPLVHQVVTYLFPATETEAQVEN